ncbi:hypothetical protein SAMN04487906_2286 [Zhouia amylolytica]|uniref:Uncharacterized protein n=1 Tax=Zhouia amylolytica TaxID=376730 RepID=A0A1I6U0W0_9FLAO|nr:DUF6686 family protein [Zhouia amylolytica]SFS95060.1 hypothetical protein SAMN04487906_2286 [Zhouia amylolytica]
MCKTLKIVNQTKNGILLYCTYNNIYHLLFNNLNFNFTKVEFKSFSAYVKNTDTEFWEREYKNSIFTKRIPIPTIQSNLLILLDKVEVKELKHLVSEDNHPFLKLMDIDYNIYLN